MFVNKKAQIGETMTWIIATIVIVVILIVSIYVTSLLAQTRKVIPYQDFERENDLIMEKSLFAYFLSGRDETIFSKLGEQKFYADLEDKVKEIEEVLK